MQLSAILLTLYYFEAIATEVVHSKLGLQAAVQLMSQLPDGNFTDLVILQESKMESDVDKFDEITILADTIYDVMTAKKIFVRYITFTCILNNKYAKCILINISIQF